MNKSFNTCNQDSVDLIDHCNQILSIDSDVKIFIGTDSINSKAITTYCTVVAFRFGKNGAHFIYQKISVNRIKDKFQRLWNEVELSVEFALHMERFGIKIDTIELDLNSNKKCASNGVVGAGVGYCTGLGFKTNIKPHEQISTRAADYILTH